MENEKPNESQELSVQELTIISGGIAIGEPYPTEPYPTEPPTNEKYSNLSEKIANYIKDKNLPYWNENHSESSS